MKQNPFGLNNFDRLAAAGAVAGADDSENLKAKTEARIAELNALTAKVQKLEAHLIVLPTLGKSRQLNRLTAASDALKELLATKLPTGAKKHVEACLNEVTSLREGVYVSNSVLDQQMLACTASVRARKEIQAMAVAAQHRLIKVLADSDDAQYMQEFYDKASAIIKRNDHEATKLAPIGNKPFIFARVPVVPVDGNISPEKLPRLGFKAESIGGSPPYAVIHNQLVLGINPKYLATHDEAAAEKVGEIIKKMKSHGYDIDQITKVQNSIKSGLKRLDELTAEDEERTVKKNAAEIQRITGLVHKAQEKITKFTDEVGDPETIRSDIDSIRRSHAKTVPAIREEAQRMIKVLEKKLKTRLRLVSERSAPFAGAAWFWLMNDRDLDMLARASSGNHVKVTRWGFAFN